MGFLWGKPNWRRTARKYKAILPAKHAATNSASVELIDVTACTFVLYAIRCDPSKKRNPVTERIFDADACDASSNPVTEYGLEKICGNGSFSGL